MIQIKTDPNIVLRKKLFLAVRDIPYRIGTRQNDASCVAKTKLLGELLSRIGLKCQVWKTVVRREETKISTELLKLAPRPTVDHFFLKILIPEKNDWKIVDATWDSGLKDLFHINKWDGVSDTKLAYISKKLEYVDSTENFNYRNYDPEDMFTKKLNEWYVFIRRGGYERTI